ncbi:hypothetical protein L208DRAFT_670478 [Tricholoma matsutake]|nr:hypothetical protein L208DRAFT_670478 [Tricholoma matsutake 945]
MHSCLNWRNVIAVAGSIIGSIRGKPWWCIGRRVVLPENARGVLVSLDSRALQQPSRTLYFGGSHHYAIARMGSWICSNRSMPYVWA